MMDPDEEDADGADGGGGVDEATEGGWWAWSGGDVVGKLNKLSEVIRPEFQLHHV